MKSVRKISKKYYLRQIVACWLVCYMLLGIPVRVAVADTTPVAGTLPSGVIDRIGIDAPIYNAGRMDMTQTAGEAIVNWNNFDIGSGATVEFHQPGVTAAVLNRVHDGDVTGIMGALTANGRVFIINPAGIVFGKTAVINVAQLIASSLNIADDDFMNGVYKFSGEGGMVSNYGQITAEQVALIGRKVLNAGVIQAPAGSVIMAAGDKVFIGNEGGDVVVEVAGVTVPQEPPMEGMGDVINEGTIDAAGGKIVLAAGDTFSRAIEGLEGLTVAVESGTGRVGQFGTLNADGVDGDGGSITLTAGEVVALGEESLTTANAGTNGDGGDVIVYSPDTALFRDGAVIEAKGGSVSGDGGFVEVSGKQHVDIFGNMDLSASAGRDGLFLLDPYNLTIVAGDSLINLDDGGVWTPTGTGSQLGIEKLEEFLGTTDVTLSTFGSGGEDGDIIFGADRYLTSGVDASSDPANNSLIVRAYDDIIFNAGNGIDFAGDGDVKLYAGVDWGVLEGSGNGAVKFVNSTTKTNPAITSNSGLDSITTIRGNIIIEAGSGGIDVGLLTTANPSTSGERPGEIRLQTDGIVTTDDEYDITTGRIEISGKGYGSLYINSAGDLTIENFDTGSYAVDVKTNSVAEVAEDALSYICLIAGRDLTIESPGHKGVLADSDGKTTSIASIWLGAGTNVFEQGGHPGIVTINGNLVAKASAPGSGDDLTKADATIRVYGSTINLNGNQDPLASAKGGSVSYQTATPGLPAPYDISGDAEFEYDPDEIDSVPPPPSPAPDVRNPKYDKLTKGLRALVDIDIEKDGSCLNCANEQIQILFDVANNEYDVDWRAGYTIEGLDFVDLAQLGILDNDDPEAQSATANIIILSAANGTLFLDTSGPYPQLKYMPPSYDEDFVWDGSSQYATFEDVFTYQVEITVDGQIFISQNFATVTITVQNEVPTLLGADDTIHMNTSADFDLSTLVTDNDGTPGVIESFIVTGDEEDGIADNTYTAEGTAGSLTYGIVEGQIPLDAGGPIATDDSRLIPYYNGVAPLTIADSTITYTPLDGYVSPQDSPTIFGYSVSDENIKQGLETAEFQNSDGLEVTVTNELPSGDGWLGTTEMDTGKSTIGLVEGGFVDNLDAVQTEADDVSVIGTPFDGAEYLTGGPSIYGGELTYDEVEDEWTYTPDTDLPGYTGDDKDEWFIQPEGDPPVRDPDYRADEQFTVQLWDGQNRYELEGDTLSVEMVTNDGTVSIDLTSPTDASGNAYFGLVHMDDTAVRDQLADNGTLDPDTIVAGTYDGTDYAGTGPLGGTLELETDGTWTYTPDGDLEGYTGDTEDTWALDGPYDLDTNPDEKFTVDLTTGEYTYTINENPEGPFLVLEGGVPVKALKTSDGTVSVELTNEAPTVTESDTTLHMNDGITGKDLAADTPDIAVDPAILDEITLYDESGNPLGDGDTIALESGTVTVIENVDGGTGEITYSFSFEPKDGYVDADGPKSFTVAVSDHEYLYLFDQQTDPGNGFVLYEPDGYEGPDIYRKLVVNEGKVEIEMTNNKPSAYGNLGEAGDPVPQSDTTWPVLVTDEWDPQQTDNDELSIVMPGTYIGDHDGELVFENDEWTYTPADGFTGTETFSIDVWDGQNIYDENGEIVGPDYGEGTVRVTVTPPTQFIPAAPLAPYEVPTIEGCPELTLAVAMELGITPETIQVGIGNALALNPTIQPCEACAALVDAASILRDEDGSRMAAMVQTFNTLAPADAPFTPEMATSIAMAFEGAAEGTQYASVMDYIDAFVQYATVLDTGLGSPVGDGDSVAFVMEKYGTAINESDNPNISAYLAAQLTTLGD